jgi:hypothetical protein
MPHKNKEDRLEYNKQYYQKNKNKAKSYYKKYKEDFVKQNQKLRKRNKDFITAYKTERCCSICGYNNHACALDFHHIHGKAKNISVLCKESHSIERIKEEIDKCIILCANCHRVQHYGNG